MRQQHPNRHTSKWCVRFRDVLARELEQANDTGAAWYWVASLRRMIADIDTGRVGVGTLKVVTRRSGELFTQYLQERGFDGLIAAEGGEGTMGPHYTYLIFDPARLRITSELAVAPAPQPSLHPNRDPARNVASEPAAARRPAPLIRAAFPVRQDPKSSLRNDSADPLAPNFGEQATSAHDLDL